MVYSTIIIDDKNATQYSPAVQLRGFMEGASGQGGFGALVYAGVTRAQTGYSLEIGLGVGGKYHPRIPVSGGWQVTPTCINYST